VLRKIPRGLFGGDQSVTDCVTGKVGNTEDIKLSCQLAAVRLNGLDTDPQLKGDLLVVPALGQHGEDLCFPR